MLTCAFCKGSFELEGKVKRNDTCPYCDMDLRCCKQCKFYDPHAYNSCREVLAERIVDKERSNFCEYFVPKGSHETNLDRAAQAKKDLEALFNKGT